MKTNDGVDLAHFLFPDGAGKDVLQRVSAADRICRLTYTEGDYTQDVCLEVHKDQTLVSSLQQADAFAYVLRDSAEIKRACFYLFNCLDADETEAPEAPALLLSRRRYEELKEKAGSYTLYFLAECLTAETGDLVHSAQLARALKCRTADGELRLGSRSGSGWNLQQAGYIEDAGGGWLLRMSCRTGEDWIVAVPASKMQMSAALFEWVCCR
ncbi:hypothetical protein [Paenibacillus tengchongensis]|uniref:hypothetical protein n=1 Tax=Paenibacillus tengchongensis TaxID=2608684 RepID=UPI00124E3774|nr:hypothetical protein [Paenibacillus tengchongensis]